MSSNPNGTTGSTTVIPDEGIYPVLSKTKIFRNVLAAATMALGLSASMSQALTYDVVGGQLVGVSDVNVGGLLYSVSFQDGSCTSLYNGCNEASDFTFNTAADAEAASNALLDQVFLDSAFGNFDTAPELTLGITSTILGIILTPFDNTGSALGFGALNRNGTTNDGVLSLSFSSTDESSSGFFTYAVWTPNPALAPVPLPPAVLMLLMALAGTFSVRYWGTRRA